MRPSDLTWPRAGRAPAIVRPERVLHLPLPASGVAGRFEIELVHARTGAVTERYAFDNLITDAGLDHIGGHNALTANSGMLAFNGRLWFCAVGTGTIAPAPTDMALGQEVARTSGDGGFSATTARAADSSWSSVTVTREFTQGQANANLSEVGFFDRSSGGVLFCRQLIRDANGEPTTITKTSDFTLRVRYEFRLYPPLTDAAGSFTLTTNGVAGTVSTVTRAYRIHIANDWNASAVGNLTPPLVGVAETTTLPSMTGSLSVTEFSGTAAAYVPGSYRITVTGILAPAQAVLATGIGIVDMALSSFGSRWGRFAASLSPKIMKTNTQRLTLVYDFSWARHTP